MTATEKSIVARLWIAVFCGYLALGATLQELPGYLTRNFGAGPFEIGATVGFAFAGTALGRPFAGYAGDSGRSREVGCLGGLLTALAAVGQVLAPNIALLLIARLAMGLGEAALFSATLPRVLAVAGSAAGGRIIGWFGLSMWGGLAIGPLLAVALTAAPGETAVWSAIIALPLVSTVSIWSTPRSERTRDPWPSDRRGLLPSGVLGPGTTLGLAAWGYGALAAVLVLFLAGPGVGGQGLGLAVFSASFLVSRAAGSPLVDRFGGRHVAGVALVVEAAGLFCLAIAGSEPIALGGAMVTGVGIGVIYPSTTTQVLARVAATESGAAVGAMTSCWDIGVLFAGPLSGAMVAASGFPLAFGAAAGASLLALAVNLSGTEAGSRRAVRAPDPSPLP